MHITLVKLLGQVLINKRKVEKISQLRINKVIGVCLVKTKKNELEIGQNELRLPN